MQHLATKDQLTTLQMFYPAYTHKDQSEFKQIFLKLLEKMKNDGRVMQDLQSSKEIVDRMAGRPLSRLLRLLCQFSLRQVLISQNQGELLFPCLDPFKPPTDINSMYPIHVDSPELVKLILTHHLNQQLSELAQLRTIQPFQFGNEEQLALFNKLRANRVQLEDPGLKLDRGVAVDKYREFINLVRAVDLIEELRSPGQVCLLENYTGKEVDLSEALARWMRELELVDRNLTFQKSQSLPELPNLQKLLVSARRMKRQLEAAS